MTQPGWYEVLADRRVEESPAEKAVRMARQAAERDDRAEALAEAERAAAIEDERDRRLFQYHQLGMSGRALGDVSADASRMADEDDAYNEAIKTMERIDKKRASRARAQRAQAEQLTAMSRSQVPADPLEAATKRAHEAFRATTRAMMTEAILGRPVQPVNRPKAEVSRSGDAVRADEQPVCCPDCQAVGADWQQSVLIHKQAELDGVELQQRSAYRGDGPMIYRTSR